MMGPPVPPVMQPQMYNPEQALFGQPVQTFEQPPPMYQNMGANYGPGPIVRWYIYHSLFILNPTLFIYNV